ncbi:hypothetical protein M407DRAFT_25410 [Tulasnella calospora MUT 4182]|uniref:Uncharacterized protein n=1 Tax=Tulasnella calospora MUT 4182 TaxID=1051891 RepID=A0A0C3KUW2_9AGAM|nr:hypothetical protein M407DRAFT_25410 [Tulasnella calospora MUT 4182]
MNIAILEFTGPHDWTSDPKFEPIRTAVSKMPLIRLHLQNCNQAAAVLRAQLTLEHLEIGLASLIVPGSPVEQLDLTSGYDTESWDDKRFKSLSESTGPITKFSMHLHYPLVDEGTRQTLRLISRHLREIEHLTIIVLGCISEQVILDELPLFRSLRRVVFIAANLAISPPQVHPSP